MYKWKRRTKKQLEKTYQDVQRNKLEDLSKMSGFLCMHKILVHAQECCACTGILCMQKNLDIFDMFCVENPPKNQTVRLSSKSGRKPFSGGLERHKE